VLFTTPPDLKDLADRRFERQYALRLQALGWTAREIAHTLVERPLAAPLPLTLSACRPPK
jgi:hypothetical protein